MIDMVAPTSLNGHFYRFTYWLHELLVRGGYTDAGQSSALLTPAGRARLYRSFLGPDPGSPTHHLAAFQRDRDPVVVALLGTNKRRGRYVNNSEFARIIFHTVTGLLEAEQAMERGSLPDAWSLIAQVHELKGNVDALLRVARDVNGEKMPHAGQRKGAEAVNQRKNEPKTEAMEWARSEFQRRLKEAAAAGAEYPTKVGFARSILETKPESGLSLLREEHGFEVTEKVITDTWLKGL